MRNGSANRTRTMFLRAARRGWRRHRAQPRFGTLCLASWVGLLLLPLLSRAQQAIVYSTDFDVGYYSTLPLAPLGTPTLEIEPLCADAVLRAHGNRVYGLGRFGCDYVQVIDGSSGATLTQWSTGAGSNPHDIEILSASKAYVSLYDRDFLLIVNPQTGAQLGQISLASFSDADGLPEADEMVLLGDRLYVALQRLDRPGGYIAANPSVVAVIDCTTDQLVDVDPIAPGVQGITLTGRNPFGELLYDRVRQKFVVMETGNYGVQDGGAEFLDPTTLSAEGFFITESALGGDLNSVRLWSDCTGYAIVTDGSFNTQLQHFDFCNGTVLGSCLTTAGFNLADVELRSDGMLLVADRDLVTPGVRLFQAPGCTEQTMSPIDFGLPPQDLALVESLEPTSVLPRPHTSALHLFPNQPNPFNPGTTLRFDAPAGALTFLDLYDLRGRHLGRLWEGTSSGTVVRLPWQGRDSQGRDLPSGVYLVRLRTAGETASRQVTLLR